MDQQPPTSSTSLPSLRDLAGDPHSSLVLANVNTNIRHPHHADTWPSEIPLGRNIVSVSDLFNDSLQSVANPSQSQCDDTTESHSREPIQVDADGTDCDVSQPQGAGAVSTSCDGQYPEPADPSSTTPNARASRLFRERRKEREKILRETVAELAERNKILEGLLLRHGIVPPPDATLRHDLSLHRSQRHGSPSIHIPGVTPVRPPLASYIEEPIIRYVHPSSQTGQRAATAPMSAAAPHEGGSRPPGRNIHSSTSEGMPAASSSMLTNSSSTYGSQGPLDQPWHSLMNRCPDSSNYSPAPSYSPRDVRPTSGAYTIHSTSRHLGVEQPTARATRSAAAMVSPVYPHHMGAISAASCLPPIPDGQPNQGYDPPSSRSGTHSRAPSDSALLAKLPALTLAEHRIVAARGGGRSFPFPTMPLTVPHGTIPTTQHESARHASSPPQEQRSAPHALLPHPRADSARRYMRLLPPPPAMHISSDLSTSIPTASTSRGQLVASAQEQQHTSFASDLVGGLTASKGTRALSPPWSHAVTLHEPPTQAFPHPERRQIPPSFPIGPPLRPPQSQSSPSSRSQQHDETSRGRTYTADSVLGDGDQEEHACSSRCESPCSFLSSDQLTEKGKKVVSRSFEQPSSLSPRPERPRLFKPSSV